MAELLGHVLREDRLKLLVTQRELQRGVTAIATKENPNLPGEVRDALLSAGQNDIEINGKFY